MFLITYCKNNNRYDILDELDHGKNFIYLKKDILNINIDSNKELFFKCKHGHEYKKNLQELIAETEFIHCPCCKNNKNLIEHKVFNNSSIMEELIFYYIKKVFPNAIHQHKCKIYNRDSELDILIEDLNLVIEHDGLQHSEPASIMDDSAKSAGLNCKNIDVIRLQHNFSHQIGKDKIISYYHNDKINIYDSLDIAIKELFAYICKSKKLSNSEIQAIKNLTINCNRDKFLAYRIALEILKQDSNDIEIIKKDSIPNKDILLDINDINLNSKVSVKRSLSKKNPRAAREFMTEKNGITPDKISVNSKTEYWFKCEKCGLEYKMAINKRHGTPSHCK